MTAKVKADMHVPPALYRWSVRGALALAVAAGIAYIPAGGVDDRAGRMRRQLDDTRADSAALHAGNVILATEVMALRTDPAAIERRARDELDMVYPGELVLRLDNTGAAPP
jgi:hypothetical protein